MNYLDTIKASVTIDGEELNFYSIKLEQYFNNHHKFDIAVVDSVTEKKKTSIWNNERETIIAKQGQSVVIRIQQRINGQEVIFKGIITGIGMQGKAGLDGSIHYRGFGDSILLESGKTLDSFIDYKLQDIADEVVRNYGNGITITNKPEFNQAIPYIQMYEESGYDFLRRLAWQYGEWFYYDGQKLIFGNPRTDNDETLVYDKDIEEIELASQILPFNYSRYDYMAESDRPLYADSNVKVKGINTYLAEAIKSSEEIFQSKTTLYNTTATTHPVHINHLLEMERARDTAKLICLSGKSNTCRVKIGGTIIVNLPPRMTSREDLGRYRVMSVIHTIDRVSGHYSNMFTAIPANMERIPLDNIRIPSCKSELAIVVDNEDPDNKGRVKVQFPWQKNARKTTNWIRVQSLYAGSSSSVSHNRGLVFIPEIDDQVIVGYEQGNPNKPYVAGGMFHGMNGSGGGSKNSIKSIITRTGHTIKLDDAEGNESITIKDKNGNSIVLKTADKSIEITAPETLTLTAKNLNIDVSDKITQIARNMQVSLDENLQMQTGKDTEIITNKLNLSTSDACEIQIGKGCNLQGQGITISSTKDTIIQADGKALLKGATEARVSEG